MTREVDWINNFLDDLRYEAEERGLTETASAISRAMEIAVRESSRKSREQVFGGTSADDIIH